MAKKMYPKNELTITDGYIVAKDGSIISVDPAVVKQANILETRYQKALWLEYQPKQCDGPDFSKFERVSAGMPNIPRFTVQTPNLDKTIHESLNLMKEIDAANVVDKLNECADQFRDLIRFCGSTNAVSDDCEPVERFDMPAIENDYGNILELDVQTIMDILTDVYGTLLDSVDMKVKDDDEDADDGEPEQG